MLKKHTPILLLIAGMLFLHACAKPELPTTEEAHWNPPAWRSSGCGEYRFDSALAVLEDSSALMSLATAILHYAAPDTNTLGWTQARFILQLESTAAVKQPYDIVYFHGGGGDVGHAGNVDEDLVAFLNAGYDVWSVEYRRGWHAGSYDSCLPRDPFNATPADLVRFDTAAVWARQDALAATAFIAGLSTDSLVLYGSSFGGYLALCTGPYADPVLVQNQRIAGSCGLFGSMPPVYSPSANVRTFLLHGETDPVNGPDLGPLYGIGPMAKGGRAVYQEIENSMTAWLMMHPGGHNFGRLSGKKIVAFIERSVVTQQIPPGSYIRDETGVYPAP